MPDFLLLLVNPSYPQVDALPYWLSFLHLCHCIAASQACDNNVLVVCKVEASQGCELAIRLRKDRHFQSQTIHLLCDTSEDL
jgi:hypothetical protein